MEENQKRIEEIRKEMGQILGIESYEGIENEYEHAIRYQLDDNKVDKFQSLREELAKLKGIDKDKEPEDLTSRNKLSEYKNAEDVKKRIEQINEEKEKFNESNDPGSIERTKLEIEKYNLQQKLLELLKQEEENNDKPKGKENAGGKEKLGIFRFLALKAVLFLKGLFKDNEKMTNVLNNWENSLRAHAIPILEEGKGYTVVQEPAKNKPKEKTVESSKTESESKPKPKAKEDSAKKETPESRQDSVKKETPKSKQDRNNNPDEVRTQVADVDKDLIIKAKDMHWLESKVKDEDDETIKYEYKRSSLIAGLYGLKDSDEKLNEFIRDEKVIKLDRVTPFESAVLHILKSNIMKQAKKMNIDMKDQDGHNKSLESIYDEIAKINDDKIMVNIPISKRDSMLNFIFQKATDKNDKTNLIRTMIDNEIMPKINKMNKEDISKDFKDRDFKIYQQGKYSLEISYALGLACEELVKRAKQSGISVYDKNHEIRPIEEIYQEFEQKKKENPTVKLDKSKGQKHYDRKELYQRKKKELKWLSNKMITDAEQYKDDPEKSLIYGKSKEIYEDVSKMSEEELKAEIRRKKIPLFENSQVGKIKASDRVALYRLRLDLIKQARTMGIKTNKRELTDIYTDIMSRGINNPDKTEKGMDDKTQGDR